ncbi:MAG: AraC family transcriptional regulator [Halioglobus sp.]
MSAPSFSTVNISNAMLALESLGYETSGMRSDLGLDSPDFGTDEHRIGLQQLEAFWQAAENLTGDPALGLHLADNCSVGTGSVLVHLLMSSANLLEGLRRLVRYQEVIGESTQISLREESACVVVEYDTARPFVLSRIQAEFFGLHSLRQASWILGREIVPLKVGFVHSEPQDSDEHSRLFACPVIFGSSTNFLALPRDALEEGSSHANSHLVKLFEDIASGYVEALHNSRFVEQVVTEISRLIVLGPVTSGEVARSLGITERQLKHALVKENTSFREIYDAYRQRTAEGLLADSDYRITDVAYLCGYTESSSFVRAFRRWQGVSPRKFREMQGNKAQGS